MSFVCRTIDAEQALQDYSKYTYALLYMISERVLTRTAELGNIDWDECLEARFFSEKEELHLFRDGQEMRAVICEETDTKDQTDREYELQKTFIPGMTRLIVREYFAYDEDGQVMVAKTRLAGLH